MNGKYILSLFVHKYTSYHQYSIYNGMRFPVHHVCVCVCFMRFFRAFSSVVRQMSGKTRKNGARPTLFLIFVLFYVFFVFYVFLCCSMYCLFCDVLCIVCVYMCTELLPPGGYPTAVKYTISYHL